MHVHPDLLALRSDDAPQRHDQELALNRLTAWREGAGAGVLCGFRRYAAGAPMEECPDLAALFAPGGEAASRLAGSLVATLCGALGEGPLAHVPLRHFTDGTVSTVMIALAPTASLSLLAVDGAGHAVRPPALSASFYPGETRETTLAGRAVAELVGLESAGPRQARLRRREIALVPGNVQQRDSACECLLLRSIEGCLVTLRLQRRPAFGTVAREYDLADGALLHQAAGSGRDSRLELMANLLGRMERRDAAPELAALASEPGAAGLRWQALRESLALDAGEGFRALSVIASDAADPLAVPAGALRAQLLEAHPQLAGIAECLV